MEAVAASVQAHLGVNVHDVPPTTIILLVVGLASVAAALFAVVDWVNTTFFAQGVDPTTQGSWAVVTGATDGIGKAYAQELASRGMNVVLVSRTLSKLQKAQEEILAESPNVSVEVIAADFSKGFQSGLYAEIASKLGDRDIGILVNNVGCSYPSAVYFHELEELGFDNVSQDVISINVESVTHMTALVLPGMVQRKRGVVVNLSSANGHLPVGSPLYAGYSAAKAYVDFFTRSLSTELAGKGVTVCAHLPYFVVSKMSKIRKASLWTPNPRPWVRSSLSKLGVGVSLVPYWSHRIEDALVFAVPKPLLAMALNSMHKGLRKRFLKKLEAAKKEE